MTIKKQKQSNKELAQKAQKSPDLPRFTRKEQASVHVEIDAPGHRLSNKAKE